MGSPLHYITLQDIWVKLAHFLLMWNCSHGLHHGDLELGDNMLLCLSLYKHTLPQANILFRSVLWYVALHNLLRRSPLSRKLVHQSWGYEGMRLHICTFQRTIIVMISHIIMWTLYHCGAWLQWPQDLCNVTAVARLRNIEWWGKQWIGKDLEGHNHGLIKLISRNLVGGTDKTMTDLGQEVKLQTLCLQTHCY
jgi:hypothetical protein